MKIKKKVTWSLVFFIKREINIYIDAKVLRQKRYTKGYNYKGYTKDGFILKQLLLWCWNKTERNYSRSRTIEELKKLKNEEFIGKGNYNRQDTHGW